jgi:hypothetical protein
VVVVEVMLQVPLGQQVQTEVLEEVEQVIMLVKLVV